MLGLAILVHVEDDIVRVTDILRSEGEVGVAELVVHHILAELTILLGLYSWFLLRLLRLLLRGLRLGFSVSDFLRRDGCVVVLLTLLRHRLVPRLGLIVLLSLGASGLALLFHTVLIDLSCLFLGNLAFLASISRYAGVSIPMRP